MSLFVSQRNFTLHSTLGHSIRFVRGKPTHVPPIMEQLVIDKGCLPCDASGKVREDAGDVTAEITADAPAKPKEPETAEERNAAIEKACREVVKRNRPADFTAGGVPSVEAVAMAMGWKADMKEIRPIWNKLKPEVLGGVKAE